MRMRSIEWSCRQRDGIAVMKHASRVNKARIDRSVTLDVPGTRNSRAIGRPSVVEGMDEVRRTRGDPQTHR